MTRGIIFIVERHHQNSQAATDCNDIKIIVWKIKTAALWDRSEMTTSFDSALTKGSKNRWFFLEGRGRFKNHIAAAAFAVNKT